MRAAGRFFWVALGATAGVLLVRRMTRTAEVFSPGGLSRSLNNLADAARDFAATVRESMAEREQELRLALGVDGGAIDTEHARELIEHPASARHAERPGSPAAPERPERPDRPGAGAAGG